MIIYDLVCLNQHRFEGWFKNSEDYQQQKNHGLLACPVCECASVQKVASPSHIQASVSAGNAAADLSKLHTYLDQRCEDVGAQFTEKARRIHYGEEELRGIRGVATLEQARALVDEGIKVIALPGLSVDKSKLN